MNEGEITNRELKLIFDLFFKKFKLLFAEFIELEQSPQKKEHITKEFYQYLKNRYEELRSNFNFSSNFIAFLKEYHDVLEETKEIFENFNILTEKYNIYSKLPANLERLFEIFRLVSNRSTYFRYYNILNTFQKNADSYLTRSNLEDKLSHLLGDSIRNLKTDLYKLKVYGLVRRNGIRYHLTKFGVIFFTALLRLEKDLQPDLLEQISRAILMHALYEEKGLDIRTYQHVQQLGFLIQELVREWIEKEEVLDWLDYVEKFDQIIKEFDIITEKYDDQPPIKRILLKTKSKISFEFSRFHEASKLLIKQNISLAERGFYPKRMKSCLNLFKAHNWMQLENFFDRFASASILPTSPLEMVQALEEKDFENKEPPENYENSIQTENLTLLEASETIEKFIPSYKIFAKRIYKLQKTQAYLSNIVKDWNLNWKTTGDLVCCIPTIIYKYKINCIPLRNLKEINNMKIKESILYLENGEMKN